MMELADLTASSASRMLRDREITALELVEFFLTRTYDLNPTLGAFITVTDDAARVQAQLADAELASRSEHSPLLGIPIALKDLFDTRDVPTTAGSKILRARVPAEDATVTTRLREAGAVVMGKANMHEFAFGVTNVNPHYGAAHNPWDLERIAGGSSGGSAVAVSARLCLGALGSDTGGSIRIPAALCGVTGLKPTFGRVSLRGVIPLSWSMDHAGPIAQTAEDCAFLLQAIAGYDPLDPVSIDKPVPDYHAELEQPLTGLVLAVPRGYFVDQVDEEILQAVENAVKVFADRGAKIIRQEVPVAEELFSTNRMVLGAEAAALHQKEMETRPLDFGPDVLKRLENGAAISAADYVRGRRRQLELIRELDLVFGAGVDLLLTPATRIAAPRMDEDPVVLSQHLTAFTAPFNLTGFPAIVVPCGFTAGGLPIGMQLVARQWNEALVLRAAYQYQSATDWHRRQPPIPSTFRKEPQT